MPYLPFAFAVGDSKGVSFLRTAFEIENEVFLFQKCSEYTFALTKSHEIKSRVLLLLIFLIAQLSFSKNCPDVTK